MKFLITGHTSGIGKALYEHFGGIGLSTSTGFDITKDSILPYLDEDTCFINNAFTMENPFAQIKLLYDSIPVVKKIICIGSNIPYEGIYKTSKDALAVACNDLFLKGHDLTLLKFGKVDTPFQDKYYGSKISINTVIKTVEFALSMPERVGTISIRPKDEQQFQDKPRRTKITRPIVELTEVSTELGPKQRDTQT